MASATVDHHHHHLHLESLPLIDLNLLSQSELLSLSFCSSSSASPSSLSDVVLIPKIDRSVFNESAGSRKQTFSRLRLAPRNQSPHNNSRISRHTLTTTSEPLDAENSQIISHLKSLFSIQSNNDDHIDHLVPEPLQLQLHDVPIAVSSDVVDFSVRKRKRGRPRKDENRIMETKQPKVFVNKIGGNLNVVVQPPMVFVNKNGVIVDLVALGRMEDPFADEFRRWTEGMENEEELLAFLTELKGEWGSRRKKKKIVDASHFGYVLPVGWKLLLGVKKNTGRVWLSCRRYIRFLLYIM